jgi:long-subunit fatty acid transport protein
LGITFLNNHFVSNFKANNIKKILLSAAVVVFATSISNAQQVKLGVKAGLNLATVVGDETGDVDSRTGFHIGGVAEVVLSDKFSFQPELVYSTQGAKEEYSDTFNGITETEEAETTLTYLNIPLMAKYYVTEGFSIEAGLQIGVLLSAETEFTFTATSEQGTFTESGTEDVKNNLKSIDFGVGVGLGYKLDNGINFAVSYNVGRSNILDGEGSVDFSQQNSVIQISVGYTFN